MPTPTDRRSPSDRLLDAGLQKFDLKLPLTVAAGLRPDDLWDRLIAVFGRWRHDEGEELVDLQDYAHLSHGPGIVLVSKRWVLCVDRATGEPGILLSTRRGIEGDISARLAQALRLLFEKAARLVGEPELKDVVKPRPGELSVTINDRLLCPNTDERDAELRPVLEALLERLYGHSARRTLERGADPGGRLSYDVRVEGQEGVALEELAARLGK